MTCHSVGAERMMQLRALGAEGKMQLFELTYDRLDEERSMQLLYGCPGLSEHTRERSLKFTDYTDKAR